MKEKLHIIPHNHTIGTENRSQLLGHEPLVVWFTGLSGSGKSTLANLLEQQLHASGILTYILDGDNVRKGLNSDLDFSDVSRVENIRRIGEVANLMADAGLVVLSAFISPFQSDRDMVRSRVGSQRFLEVFVDCPLEVCEQRDVKGLYQKARAGEISSFTGISSPFEAPQHPDLVVKTNESSQEECLNQLLNKIKPLLNQKL
ncbi:MAG: adenylyl-sulfate kinase [Schleiferiaceae bacterium]|nr:adenylyl-sulfate kinase [Schleiferiaceae bacterium]